MGVFSDISSISSATNTLVSLLRGSYDPSTQLPYQIKTKRLYDIATESNRLYKFYNDTKSVSYVLGKKTDINDIKKAWINGGLKGLEKTYNKSYSFKPKILLLYTVTSSNDMTTVSKYNSKLTSCLGDLSCHIKNVYDNIKKGHIKLIHGVANNDIYLENDMHHLQTLYGGIYTLCENNLRFNH